MQCSLIKRLDIYLRKAAINRHIWIFESKPISRRYFLEFVQEMIKMLHTMPIQLTDVKEKTDNKYFKNINDDK